MKRLEGISFTSRKLQTQYNAATAIKDRGNMNVAYEDYERPSTPSFSGNYLSNYQPKPTSPYLFGAGEPVESAVPINSSTIEFLPPKEKPNKTLCTAHRLLVVLLLLFIILSVVMIALYITKSSISDKNITNSSISDKNSGTTNEVSNGSLCRKVPAPVVFKTLPNRLQEELKDLESVIEQRVEQHTPGAITANIVYRDKVIWQGHFGTIAKSTTLKRKPTERTIFPVASLTKVLTVMMLYKLYDRGFVSSLDDPVTSYAPDFFVNNPFNANITLRDLASHRSGLQREAPCYPDTKTNLCPYTTSEMMQRLRNLTLFRRPGSDPHYSNLGFALLGHVLGIALGSEYEDWIRINLLSTLGMSDTVFKVDQRLEELIPVGYFSSTEFANVLEWGWLNPSGGAFSTVADFAKLEIALFNDGSNRYLSEAVTEELFSAGYMLPSGKDFVGTPWEMQVVNDLILRRKNGYIYGYSSSMILVPEIKLAFNIFCTNCSPYVPEIDRHFSEKFLSTFKETLREEALRDVNTPPETKKYVGIYHVDGLGGLKYIEVKMKEGNLHLFTNGVNDIFVLNFTRPLHFKIIIQQRLPCMQIFVYGVDQESIVFDAPSQSDGLCDKFVMYGAHPSGRTYFYRDRKRD